MDMTSIHVDTTSHPAATAWRPLRGRWLAALIVPTIPFIAAGLVAVTGSGLFWWSGPVLVFVLMPALDAQRADDTTNPPEELVADLEADHWYRWCTYLFIPLQFASLVYASAMWSSGTLSTVESFGLALTVGCVAGIAINTAHELGHKHPPIERWLSKVSLSQTGYGHFQLEHNRGHHAKVSTPDDPASSRLGEHFWEFLPRTVAGSLRSAITLERAREARLGQRFWSPRNELLNAWVMSLVLFGTLIAVFGWAIAPWLALQAIFGFCLLEVVNYIEHYGLLRDRRADGRYERCRPEHSWNASQVASNLILFQLQRHSDHHAFPTRRYQTLRHFDDVPQLPTGYAGMIVLAAFPPLWRRVMDPKVIAFYDGDVSRTNLHPRRRDHYLERYGSSPAEATAEG
jgi:alkane 1-monooxygenase